MLRILCLVLVFFLGGPAWARGPLVVASIFPLYEMVREAGGDYIQAHLLLPPGADPHSWEPTPQDLLLLRRADLVFVVGHGLEPWLEDLFQAIGREKLLQATAGAPLLYLDLDSERSVDPHVWLDFKWDAQLALRLGKALSSVDPSRRETYQKNAQHLKERFLLLDQKFKDTLKNCQTRTMIIAGHAAFGYWARAYGLEIISLAGLSPEAEPTPSALRRAVRLIKEKGLKAVFYEELSSRRFAELLARETGVKIYYLSPGATLTKDEMEKGLSFFSLMERNLRYLAEGLSCPKPE